MSQLSTSLKKDFSTAGIDVEDISSLGFVIGSHLPTILDLVSKNHRLLVISPTGTGKSLGIPWILARTGMRVVISMPTVTSVESAAIRQKEINPEISVGYATESKVYYNESSQIIYATSEHIRKALLRFYQAWHSQAEVPTDQASVNESNIVNNLISATDVLMLDEIHTGSKDDTINYELWSYGYQNGKSLPKLILSSATAEERKYTGIMRYRIDISQYPIYTYYHTRNYGANQAKLLEDTAKIIFGFHNSELIGDILVFAAGRKDIFNIISYLEELLTNSPKVKPIILPLYSGLSAVDRNRIYRRYDLSRETGQIIKNAPRKIIISTNIAETSITIKNIKLVIDTLTEKRAVTSPAGSVKLSLTHISKSSSIQRKGRTGRNSDGLYYIMGTSDFYLNLEEHKPDEVYRIPPYPMIMELIDVNLNPRDILTMLSPKVIDDAILLLNKLELVKNNNVQDAGYFTMSLPLNIRNSTILWKWYKNNYPIYPAIVIVSLIDTYGPSYYFYPPQFPGENKNLYLKRKNDRFQMYFEKFRGYSDVHTMINMWNLFTSSVGNPRLASSRRILQWAKNNSINNRKLQELVGLIKQISRILNTVHKIKIDEGPFTTDGAINTLRPLASVVYNNEIMTWSKGSQPNYFTPLSEKIYHLDQKNSVNNLSSKYPERIIPFIKTSIDNRINLISVALDI